MSFKVVSTPAFERSLKRLAKKYTSLKEDFSKLLVTLKDSPREGDAIGKDCYKVRMAIRSKGKGKSDGARVITCVKVTPDEIFLLAMYDKSEMESLPESTLKLLLIVVEQLRK
ncbi:MAG: hypothetical protein SH856_02010 [Flavobacteriales bacterium]|nr:hypothetical protein [Flavobacteriales bacterium]